MTWAATHPNLCRWYEETHSFLDLLLWITSLGQNIIMGCELPFPGCFFSWQIEGLVSRFATQDVQPSWWWLASRKGKSSKIISFISVLLAWQVNIPNFDLSLPFWTLLYSTSVSMRSPQMIISVDNFLLVSIGLALCTSFWGGVSNITPRCLRWFFHQSTLASRCNQMDTQLAHLVF